MRRILWIFCCLFFIFMGTRLEGQIAFVQAPTACVSNLGATSLTCTFAHPVAAGDTLIASTMPLLTPGAAPFTATVSDSVNGSWAHGALCYSAYNAQADFFYLADTAAGSDTVTVTYSNAAELYLSVAEYSGVDRSAPFDAAPTCSPDLPSSSSFTGPTLTTTTATDMLLSTMVVGNAGVTTISSPYTERVARDVTLADDRPGTAGAQTGPTWSTQYNQDGFVIAAALKAAGSSGPATLTVGPGGQYASPCAAFAHLADGDTLQVDANGGTPYYDTADCLETAPNVTIVGVNGRPIIDGSKASIAKALWVIDGHDVAIDNFEFRNAGASTSSTNAEAIRIEPGTTASPNGGNVTVERSYIHDNFEGILSDGIASGAAWYSATPYITFQYDEFADNGYGDGLTHNIYIGCCGNMNFTLQYSWSHDSYVGHAVKDRAPISNILYNLIGDSAGNSSYLLDFPLGGSTYVVGNSLYKMATTNSSANAAAVIFADVSDNGAGDPEYGTANQDLHFINNTMILDPANQNGSGSTPAAFVSLGCLQAAYSDCALPPNGPALTVPAVVENNIFLGAETEATNQAGAFVENNLLQSNASPSELAALKFNHAAAFDFRLTAGSPAIGAGVYPPTNNAGAADPKALAMSQYVHPENKAAWPTPSGTTMDAGAFPAQTIAAPSLNLSYTETVQAPNSGVITVTGLPTPASGRYNYASFVSMNQAAIPSIESVASSTGTVTTTFTTAAVTTATVVPIYVYVDGTVLTASVTVTPATLPAATIAAVSGSGQTAAVGSNFANPLVVVVKDANSNPVSGVTVTFAGTGIGFPSGAMAVTNSSGQAQITAQPTAIGTLTITASAAGVTTPASFSETGTADTAASIAFVQAPTSCVSNVGATSLTCTFAHPVAAGDVLIASAMPLLAPGASPFTTTISDSVNGGWVHGAECFQAYGSQADFFYFADTASGSDTVTVNYSNAAKLYLSVAEYSGVNTSTPFDVAPTCSAYISRLTANTGPTLATTASTDMLISALVEGNTGTTTITSPYTKRVLSNVMIADAPAGTAGTQPGPTWSIQYDQGGFVIGAALKAAGGGGPTTTTITVISGSGQTAAVGTSFANPLVVVVKDAGSNPVSGATVTFAGTGVSFPSGATTTTNGSGQAQVAAQPAATGAVTITATVAGAASPATFSETGTAGTAASVAVVSGSGQTAPVGSNFTNTLVVVVKDAGSNPVSGATVTFAGTGVSFPSGATAVTNSSGQAQVTAQPTATGALTITATVAGAASPATFSETGTAGTAASVAVVSGSGQTAPVGSNFANPLVVVVKDASSNPVSGATVIFAGTGVSFPSGVTAITNSSGHAQIAAQPAATGALTVTASVAGVSTPASFSETGTASTASTIAFVQAPRACVSNVGATSLTCTFAHPVAPGDVLIASAKPLLAPGASPFTAAVSDSLNGGWVHGTQCYAAYNGQADFFYVVNTASGSDTVTVTYSHAAKLYLSVAEYSGVNTSTPFDVAPTCSTYISRLTADTGPTLTTTASTDMLISALVVGNAGVTTVSSPYIERVLNNLTMADDLPGTAGMQPGPTWNTQYGQSGFVIGAALKAASGSQ